MPQFSPDEVRTAVAPITVMPSTLSCEAEVFLGPDEVTKIVTSGLVPFTSTGASQDISLPVIMPSAEGTYHVFIDVYAEGILIAAYKAIEDVVIVSAPIIAGSIIPGLIWYEGLAGWENIQTGREIPKNAEIYLSPSWVNESGVNIIGHVDLSVTYPDGTEHTLSATLNQDRDHAPQGGWYVQFEPFTSSQEGTYTMVATLSSAGQVLDSVTFELVVAVPEVSHFVYSNISCWEEAAGFKYLKFRCRIKNTGTLRETHIITIYKYRSDLGEGTALPEMYEVTVTLDPGKSTEYAYPSTHVGAYRYTWCFFALDDGGGKSAKCCVYVGE